MLSTCFNPQKRIWVFWVSSETHTRPHICLTLRSGSGRCVCEFVWLPRVHTVYAHVLLAPSSVVLGPEKEMIRNFTCNRSMWRTCYWLGAFSRASVGPLNLRGSPWEQYWRPEEFNTVNVQPFLISAEKSHSMNSSQAFPAVERVWMAPQKTVNTLPCLPLFISLTLGKHTGYKARFQGLLTFRAYCQDTLQLILPFLSAFFYCYIHFVRISSIIKVKNTVTNKREQRIKRSLLCHCIRENSINHYQIWWDHAVVMLLLGFRILFP